MSLGQASYSRDYANPVSEERDGCHPRFHMEAEKIIVDGVERYRDVEMVEIFMPGNPTTKPDLVVNDEFRNRWPKQYAAFKANQDAPLDGTPLEEWNILSRAQMMTLKSFEFRTVEDVADMSETAVQRIGLGARQLKLKACAYLNDSEKSKIVNKAVEDAAKFEQLYSEMQAQNKALNEQIALLGDQMRQMAINQQMSAQNTASTPRAMEVPETYAQAVASPLAAFAKFAEESPPVPPAPLQAEAISVSPPSPRRGRPSKADIEARNASNG